MKLTDFQERWLAALESGEYEQAKGRLVDGCAFCCLGVACQLEGLPTNGGSEFVDGDQTLEDGELSRRLSRKLGLYGPSGGLKTPVVIADKKYPSLIALNDDAEWTFVQIAAYIRANPENVFTNSEQETE